MEQEQIRVVEIHENSINLYNYRMQVKIKRFKKLKYTLKSKKKKKTKKLQKKQQQIFQLLARHCLMLRCFCKSGMS